MACHVLDVLDAIIESGKTSAFVDIESGFERPAPLNLPEGGACFISDGANNYGMNGRELPL